MAIILLSSTSVQRSVAAVAAAELATLVNALEACQPNIRPGSVTPKTYIRDLLGGVALVKEPVEHMNADTQNEYAHLSLLAVDEVHAAGLGLTVDEGTSEASTVSVVSIVISSHSCIMLTQAPLLLGGRPADRSRRSGSRMPGQWWVRGRYHHPPSINKPSWPIDRSI
jgi:hypothetical protein